MALNNYANLKTAIANFLARDDLTSEIDDFIDLTEADFNRRLRIRAPLDLHHKHLLIFSNHKYRCKTLNQYQYFLW